MTLATADGKVIDVTGATDQSETGGNGNGNGRARLVALVTGGSRGIGASTVRALATRGYDVALTYRNKATRAEDVAGQVRLTGRRALAVACDMTRAQDRAQLVEQLRAWSGHLDVLVLNASGGLERDLLAENPDYPMHINRDAQAALVEALQPLMPTGSTIVFVTSHWAHLYGRIPALPHYDGVAESKHAGEVALRARQAALAEAGIRLLVATADMIEGTITPRLLERVSPGLHAARVDSLGTLPTAAEMGEIVASAATDPSLPTGYTVVIGGSLESLLKE